MKGHQVLYRSTALALLFSISAIAPSHAALADEEVHDTPLVQELTVLESLEKRLNPPIEFARGLLYSIDISMLDAQTFPLLGMPYCQVTRPDTESVRARDRLLTFLDVRRTDPDQALQLLTKPDREFECFGPSLEDGGIDVTLTLHTWAYTAGTDSFNVFEAKELRGDKSYLVYFQFIPVEDEQKLTQPDTTS